MSLTEISDNYEAVSTRTGSVYYFGEYATQYKDGQVTGHEGSWKAGENGAQFGMLMPGVALLGARFLQENAAPIALDRSEIIRDGVSIRTPAGSFTGCLKVYDTDGLDLSAPALVSYSVTMRVSTPAIFLVRLVTVTVTTTRPLGVCRT